MPLKWQIKNGPTALEQAIPDYLFLLSTGCYECVTENKCDFLHNKQYSRFGGGGSESPLYQTTLPPELRRI